MSILRTSQVSLEVLEKVRPPLQTSAVYVEVLERFPPPFRVSQVSLEAAEERGDADPGVTQHLLEVADQQQEPEVLASQQLLETADQQEDPQIWITQELVEVADQEEHPQIWVTQELIEIAVQCPDEEPIIHPEFYIIGESSTGRVTLELQEPYMIILAVRVDVFAVNDDGSTSGPVHDSGWMAWQPQYQITGLNPTQCYLFRYSWLDPCFGPFSNFLQTRILDIDAVWTFCDEPSATTDWSQ